ncbi:MULTISPECIES: lipopolysaccharide biosynthesis protein [unclassified Streptomyces]|uniref:lipopolysaccharide biosynthesis protein n=1 Tax=unclassified Streptomyces TaxID=2593676 RepID=UPI002253B4E9|nr:MULTISPECIES: lipopolysaccharide biosynthesis protein [unclassified Streptomyces]MCX4880912.1 lipopolysaccharide biosynthesis protein [Streptomyces sp. NBC_00847]MCX5420952.1 lipopolysaccharide biosynthesis protein [Streptomyces sp. NBC_00078]
MTDTPTRRDRLSGRSRPRARRLPSWWLLPAGALLGAVAGGAYGVAKPPQYTATSSVVAVAAGRSDVDCADALGFAQAYGRVAPQLAVLGDAQVTAGVPVAQLRDSVQVATSPDAPMIAVSATSSSPAQAVDIANAVSGTLVTQAGHTKAGTGIRLEPLSRALRPTEPSSPSWRLTSLVGASAGGLLGGLTLLARPRRTTRDDGPGQATVPAPTHAADARGTLA